MAAKDKDTGLVSLRFVQGYKIYAKGDVAGFSAEEAEAILEQKTEGKPVAVEWTGKPEKEDKAEKN